MKSFCLSPPKILELGGRGGYQNVGLALTWMMGWVRIRWGRRGGVQTPKTGNSVWLNNFGTSGGIPDFSFAWGAWVTGATFNSYKLSRLLIANPPKRACPCRKLRTLITLDPFDLQGRVAPLWKGLGT